MAPEENGRKRKISTVQVSLVVSLLLKSISILLQTIFSWLLFNILVSDRV